MDKTDEKLLDIMKGDARISFQELGDKLGMSRVAAMKRVRKLEKEGVIKQYNTCIYREDEVTMLMDIVIRQDKFDKVVKYIATRCAYIRQILRTTGDSRIHVVAVAPSVEELDYLTQMIREKCGEAILRITTHGIREVIKDVYGGVDYEREDLKDSD